MLTTKSLFFVVLITGTMAIIGMEDTHAPLVSDGAVHDIDDDISEDIHVETYKEQRKIKREKRQATIRKLCTAGMYTLLLAGAGGGITTTIQSIHDHRVLVALPYEDALPSPTSNCTYEYITDCNQLYLANRKECYTYCNNTHDKCAILAYCGHIETDPQLSSGLISFFGPGLVVGSKVAHRMWTTLDQ